MAAPCPTLGVTGPSCARTEGKMVSSHARARVCVHDVERPRWRRAAAPGPAALHQRVQARKLGAVRAAPLPGWRCLLQWLARHVAEQPAAQGALGAAVPANAGAAALPADQDLFHLYVFV